MDATSTIARFLSKVDRGSSCWEWTAACYPNGYGAVKNQGKQGGAHRLSYELFVGEIPEGMVVMHKCDNKKCVRPDHLAVGTQADNMADKVRKGRASRRGNPKINADAVRDIRKRHAAGAETLTVIAKSHGIALPTASGIVHRYAWPNVE